MRARHGDGGEEQGAAGATTSPTSPTTLPAGGAAAPRRLTRAASLAAGGGREGGQGVADVSGPSGTGGTGQGGRKTILDYGSGGGGRGGSLAGRSRLAEPEPAADIVAKPAAEPVDHSKGFINEAQPSKRNQNGPQAHKKASGSLASVAEGRDSLAGVNRL
jgi:hypothetical protein